MTQKEHIPKELIRDNDHVMYYIIICVFKIFLWFADKNGVYLKT